MKKSILGSLMILALAAVTAAQAVEWKGFYGGLSLGGAIGRADAQTTTIFSSTGYFAMSSIPVVASVGAQQPNANGLAGSIVAGYSGLKGIFIYGFEVDLGAMRLNGSQTGTGSYPVAPNTGLTITQSIRTNWLLTARPRIGISRGRFLFSLTGGLALTYINYQEVFTDTFADCHENGGVKTMKTGWVGGGSIEFQARGRWSVKAEYLYADFGTVSTTSTNLTGFNPPISFPTNVFTHIADLRAHVIRAGINYRF